MPRPRLTRNKSSSGAFVVKNARPQFRKNLLKKYGIISILLISIQFLEREEYDWQEERIGTAGKLIS